MKSKREIQPKTAVEISSETAKSAKNREELSEFQEELAPTIFTKLVKSNCCKSHDISQTFEHLFAPFAFFAVSAKRSTAVFRVKVRINQQSKNTMTNYRPIMGAI